MAAATKDGLPRKAFAYAPTAKPDSWKLPIYNADGSVDTGRLPAAAAALSEGGFRGEKADIPSDAMAMVKAKLRTAYRKWKGSDVEYPASIREGAATFAEADGEGQVRISEATVLLDKAAQCATVISLPNGDTVVIPQWDGAFQMLAKPYDPPGESTYVSTWDIEDAASTLASLTRLRGREGDDAAQSAMLDRAISAVSDFLRAEAGEVSEAYAEAVLSEAGRRNSSRDQKTIQNVHDLAHELGAVHLPDKTYSGMDVKESNSAPVIEAAVEIIGQTPQLIDFTESSADGGPGFVMLSEAAATFDDSTRTVTITPIKPGFGNKRDGFFYPTKTLREATEAGMFDHLKMYRNHPAKSEEKDRPERNVNDWFATTREAEWDETLQRPRVPIRVHSADDYAKFKDAPEQIAFSIRGGGNAREGRVDGQEAKIVESLVKVRSVDWVTEAGAGGAIEFAESAAEEIDMDIKGMTTEQLKEELRIREAAAVADAEAKPKGEAAEGDDKPKGEAETPNPTPPNPTPEPTPAPVEAKVTVTTMSPEDLDAKFEAFKASFIADQKAAADEAEKAKGAKAEMQEAARKAVAEEVGKTTLPKAAKDQLVAEFAEAGYGDGFGFADEAGLRTAVSKRGDSLRAFIAQITGNPVRGLGSPTPEPVEEADKPKAVQITESFASRMGDDAPPPHGKSVWTAEELAGETAKLASAPATTPERAAEVSEAAASIESGLAQRLGV